jgi:arylsulfatase A-like enzyme
MHARSRRLFGLAAACTTIAFLATFRIDAATPDGGLPPPKAVSARPDIVLVTIDALRQDHVSAYGYRRFTTPAIDRFARTALTFTHAVTQAPYTKAAVASVMSGLYPSSHKAVTTKASFAETMTGRLSAPAARTDVLSSGIVTLAERLQAAGYHTLGFTGNPFLIEPFGFAQGFDIFEFFPGGDFANANQIVASALERVKRVDGKPLFLWLHLMEPHSPYAPPAWTAHTFSITGAPARHPLSSPPPPWLLKGSPGDLRLYEEAYDEEILAVDAAFDSLLRGVQDLREGRRTVVVVTADHGEQFLDHGGWEHSDQLYDELIRVPLMVRAPDVAPEVVDRQVELVDLYPTCLDYAEIDSPGDLPGRSLASASRRLESETAFSEISGSQYAVRTDDWKLIVGAGPEPKLFDLRADPHEHRNVVDRHPVELDRLRRLTDRWLTAALERGRGILPESAVINPAILQRLRALGYVGK